MNVSLLEPERIPFPDDMRDPFTDEWDDAPQTKPGGIILVASPLQLHTARCLALARKQAHDGKRKPCEDLGEAANERCEFSGLLAELLVLAALEAAGLNPTGYVLLSDYGQPGPDFRIGRTIYDTKSTPFGSCFFNVNEEKRIEMRARGVHAVLPVVFCANNAAQVMHPVPIAELERWTLRQGHSPYRGVHVSQLTPLLAWRAL